MQIKKTGINSIDKVNEYFIKNRWFRVITYCICGILLVIYFGSLSEDGLTLQDSKSPSSAAKQVSRHTDNAVNTKKNLLDVKEVKSPRPIREKISDWVFTKYTKSQYPKTFTKFGSRMPDVEKARQAGAFLAAKNDRCFYVDMSELSDSSTRTNIKIFTDCYDENKKFSERYRFEEVELKDSRGRFYTEETISSSGEVKTIMERAFPKDAALQICRESVRSSAQFPSSVDFSIFGQTASIPEGSGETWVELKFEAKNGMGAILPYKAVCTFPLVGKPTIEISRR